MLADYELSGLLRGGRNFRGRGHDGGEWDGDYGGPP